MKHTKGPWIAHTDGMDATVTTPDGRSFMVGDLTNHEENIANARLIAAAPDLLEACEAAWREVDKRSTAGELLFYAIQKATK